MSLGSNFSSKEETSTRKLRTGAWDGEENYLLVRKFFAGVVFLRNAAGSDGVFLFCVRHVTAASEHKISVGVQRRRDYMKNVLELNALGETVPSFEGSHLWLLNRVTSMTKQRADLRIFVWIP